MIALRTIRLLLLVLLPCSLLAQVTQTGSPVAGDMRSIAIPLGTTETNVIFATLAGGVAADDNNNDSQTDPIAGTQYFADPSVAIQETRKHLAWDLSYRPSVRAYLPSSSRPDVFNQSFSGDLHYAATKRLGIGLRQDYLRTSDPFEQLAGTPLQPGASDFRHSVSLSQAEIDYRLAKHTTVGVDGAFKVVHGNEIGVPSASFINTHDTLGSTFLSHQLSARQAVGVQLQFLDMVFPGQDARTRSYGALLFDQMSVSPRMNFMVFAGPEYSQIHNQVLFDLLPGLVFKIPTSSILWSPSVGGIFDWHGQRLGLVASFARRVSDGGGLLGAVEMNDGSLHLKRKFGKRWVADLDGQLTEDKLLNEPGENLELLQLGAGVNYELREHLWIRAEYQRLHHIGGFHPSVFSVNHDRVTLSVERYFTLPIGR